MTKIALTAGVLLIATSASAATTCLWQGAGQNNNWSFAPNWSCGGVNRAPQNGDTLQFTNNPLVKSFVSVNDLPGLQLFAVQIDYPRYQISGAGIVLGGATGLIFDGVPDATDATTATFTAPITLNGPLSILQKAPDSTTGVLSLGDINLNGFALTLDPGNRNALAVAGTISGGGTVTTTNHGTVTLSGHNTFTGQLLAVMGALVVTNPQAFGASGPGNETVLGVSSQTTTAVLLSIRPGADVTIDESFICRNGNSAQQQLSIAGGFTVTLTGSIGLLRLNGPPLGGELGVLTDSKQATVVFAGPIVGDSVDFLGAGTAVFANAGNTLRLVDILDGTVRVGAVGAFNSDTIMSFVPSSAVSTPIFDLNGIDTTLGGFTASGPGTTLLGSATLTVVDPTVPTFPNTYFGKIVGNGHLVKNGAGQQQVTLSSNDFTGSVTVNGGTFMGGLGSAFAGAIVVNAGTLNLSTVTVATAVTINSPGAWQLTDQNVTLGSLAGSGSVFVGNGSITVGGNNASTTFSGSIGANTANTGAVLTKVGTGTLTLGGQNNYNGATVVSAGALIVNGTLSGVGGVALKGGTLGGTGTVTGLVATGGAVSPGNSPGILHASSFTLGQNSGVLIDLNGPTAGTGYDQIDVTNGDAILNSPLTVTRRFGPAQGAQFTIINVAAGHKVTGTFTGLAEGATLDLNGQHFSITYKGGDGNDVVLTALEHPPAVTYYLSEGATGAFFDEDVLIANPNSADAPVTLTFSKEDGSQVSATQTIAAQSRATVHVDTIPGLQATAASTQVRSEQGLPLVVERTMFWDQSHYAGSTGSAVDQPAQDWFFAEGSQGFFNTFVLVINPNATPTDVTFTFLRESDAPVTKTITVGANTRLTLDAGTVPEIVNRSFGITVHGTQPIMAERSMYFGTTPTRLWSGGTESAGVTALSTHWFLAEGATGGFFDTFILLSNPNSTAATVTLQYLLDTGETINVPKVVPANARLTTNIETEADARLHNAAVSTVVTSDQPIIAERSMYWPGAAVPWGEGHNSFGVVDAGLHWGLAEGRTGGPFNFHTYILLANPQSTAANVTVTFVRESGAAPVTKTFTVPATSRFNIDAGTITELQNESFGADIHVTNGVPIIVERSMYWDSNGFQFSGGTNATGSRLP